MIKEKMINEKTLTVFSAGIAKDLINNGFQVVNINPNSRNKDKTVFYFAITNELKEFLKERYVEIYNVLQ